MAWTGVQTKTAVSSAAGTAIAATFDTAPTSGNFLLAVVFHTGTNVLPDSSYGSYSIAFGNFGIVYHFFKIAAPGESATFSVTSPSSVTWAVVLKEYGEIAGMEVGNDTVQGDATFPGGASSYTLDNTGICEYNDLCVASFAQEGSARTATWSSGWAEVADLQPPSSSSGLAVADQVLTTKQDVPLTVTLSGNTVNSPTIINQELFAFGDPGRFRPQQQSWAQR